MNERTKTFFKTFAPWDDPDATPFIEFRNVTKRYGAVTAVDQLDLTIFEREFFALLGPSGCGKTTLMRMLAGFEEVTEGDVLLEGKSLKGVPPYRRPVNMMFQSYALFPHMSVAKNIAFGLKQEGMAKGEMDDRVAEMLSLVQLKDFGHRKPDQLSGGQRQRVALARSLAKKPRVLLLDEPLGALDRKLREQTQFELVDLQESLGITFMIVTHDQEEAMTVADRIAVMRDGKLMQIDPPVQIYERPNSRYVASFLGDINMIEATVTGRKGGSLLMEDSGGAALEAEHDDEIAKGTTVTLALRPQKITLSRTKPKTRTNVLAGQVWDIAYLGDVTYYKIKFDNGAFAKIATLNTVIDKPMTWEERVYASFDPSSGRVLTR